MTLFPILYLFFYLPPLTWTCLSFIAGITAYYYVQNTTAFLLMLVAAWSCIAYCLKRHQDHYVYKKILLPFPFFFLIGLLLTSERIASTLTIGDQIDGFYTELIGVINDIDSIDHSRFLQIIELKPIIKNFRSRAKCLIYSSSKTPFLVGDTISIQNIRLKKPEKGDFKLYCIKEGIHATGCADLQSAQLVERPSFSLSRLISNLKLNVLNKLSNKMSRLGFTFFSSFFLGNRKINKNENNQLKKWCKNWGMSHYLARSGIHLVVFVVALEYLLCFVPIKFILKQLLLLFFTFIYFILTWTSISFIRATCSLLLLKLYTSFGIHQNTLSIIVFVTLAILILNPLQLFFLDFQLSFGITFLIGCLSQYKKYISRVT